MSRMRWSYQDLLACPVHELGEIIRIIEAEERAKQQQR